jgi:hypothetical protein
MPRHRNIFLLGFVVLVGTLLFVVAIGATTASAPPALRILSDTELPATLQKAHDVRWASETSVYLALLDDGVVEAGLAPPAPPPKVVVPAREQPGGFWNSVFIGASPEYLAVTGSVFSVTWRRIGSSERQEKDFEFVHDLDVSGTRLALVGARRGDKRSFSPDGAIAWVGSLDKALADLKPLVFDATGAGAANMAACGSFDLGAVRFLADGSILVVPGVQPGAYRFSGEGKLLRAWDTVELGVDTDCASLDSKQARRLAVDYPQRLAWINQRRVVDDILPLPSAPGLLIRTVEQGVASWTLKLLLSDGAVRTLAVPIHGTNSFVHLRGDIRGDRLIFLLSDWQPSAAIRPHLLLAARPEAP